MDEKKLMRISDVRFGTVSDYPFLFGLILGFQTEGSGIGCGGKYTINMSKECKWESPLDRAKAIEKMCDEVVAILEQAKVNSVAELKGIPVEVEIKDNCFQDFRILTEVL